jgi:hypothetical protein
MRLRTDEFAEIVGSHEGFLVMLKAYFDESGIHQGAQVCVVAGFWGKKGPWRKFEQNWRLALREFKVPLEQFHAKEVIQRNGMFHRWDDDKHKEFLEQIGKVVSESRIHPVCYGLYNKDFFSFSLPERKFLTGGSWDSENHRFLTTGSPDLPPVFGPVIS